MNTSTSEVMLDKIVQDIRNMLADLGILCNRCTPEIDEQLCEAKTELEKADTAIRYAILLKKNERRKA